MLKKILLIMVLLSLSNICYASDFLASVGKSTSDLVVERKNEIMYEKQMEWLKYKHDKLHEYRMKKAEKTGIHVEHDTVGSRQLSTK